MTDDHPFWVENIGWVDSDDLEPGMLVMDLDGSWHGVKSMLPAHREGLAYNFEVGDFHTYFVGESDVWVHNCPEGPNSTKLTIEDRAADLANRNDGKNRVSISHPNGRTNIDLVGKSHNVKGTDVPTPHVQDFKNNVISKGPRAGQVGNRSPDGPTRSATADDLRLVDRYLRSQGK